MTRLLLVLSLLCLSAAARADWQFTKWGMTPEEVVAASKGTASLIPAPEIVRAGPDELAAMKYRSGDLGFDVSFWFDRGKLTEVALELSEPSQSSALMTALLSKYGRPLLDEAKASGRFVTWHTEGMQIVVQRTSDNAYVSYRRHNASTAKGL